jgi:hypothetical protein
MRHVTTGAASFSPTSVVPRAWDRRASNSNEGTWLPTCRAESNRWWRCPTDIAPVSPHLFAPLLGCGAGATSGTKSTMQSGVTRVIPFSCEDDEDDLHATSTSRSPSKSAQSPLVRVVVADRDGDEKDEDEDEDEEPSPILPWWASILPEWLVGFLDRLENSSSMNLATVDPYVVIKAKPWKVRPCQWAAPKTN